MSLRRPYWISAFGHFGVLAMLMALGAWQRPDRFVGGVSIVLPPPGSGSGQTPAVAAVNRQQELEPQPEPEPQPPPQEKKRPQPELNVVREPDPEGLLPPRKGDIPSTRPRERDAERSVPPAPRAGAAQAAGDGSPGRGTLAGPGSGIGVEGGVLGANAPWYLVLVHDKLAASWQPPAAIGRAGTAEVVIQFVVEADGRVSGIEPVRSSDNSFYDRAAMSAVLGASPLPPPPDELGGGTVAIRVTFTQEY